MNELDILTSVSIEKKLDPTIIDVSERIDFLDTQILRKFYVTGENFPNDTQPHCFPVLYLEMRANNNLKIGTEALRKRLDNMVDLGLLEKVRNSNPAAYLPVQGRENLVRAAIVRFFTIRGMGTFL